MRLLLFALCIPCLALDVSAQPQPLLYTVPFQAGDHGYLIYRIPAIGVAPDKPLMAFAE